MLDERSPGWNKLSFRGEGDPHKGRVRTEAWAPLLPHTQLLGGAREVEPHPQEQRLPIRPGSSLPRDKHVFHTPALGATRSGFKSGPLYLTSWETLGKPQLPHP